MQVVTTADRPDLEQQAADSFRVTRPEFILHDPVSKRYVPRVGQCFARHDVLLLDEGRVVAGGWGVPMAWDGNTDHLPDGYDGALARSVDGHEAGVPATTLYLIAVAVVHGQSRRGLAASVRRTRRLGPGRHRPRGRPEHVRRGEPVGATQLI